MDRSGVEQGGLRAAVRDLHMAAKQVGVTGSTEVVERATEIVTGARKELYRLLAESLGHDATAGDDLQAAATSHE